MSLTLTYGFLTRQLYFDLQVLQTLNDCKWTYISSQFAIPAVFSTWSCSHSTLKPEMGVIPSYPIDYQGLRTTPLRYPAGRSPPQFHLLPGSGHHLLPGWCIDFRLCFVLLNFKSSPYKAKSKSFPKCTAAGFSVMNKTCHGSECQWMEYLANSWTPCIRCRPTSSFSFLPRTCAW